MRRKDLVHEARGGVDAELVAALDLPVTAVCGYRWLPTRFGESECGGLPKCPLCFPPAVHKAPAGRPKEAQPHYVYRCFDVVGRLIYVGCTNNPPARLAGHGMTSWWADQIHSTRLLVFPNRAYALTKEREAIGEERPRWNVRGKWNHRSDAWGPQDYFDMRHAITQAIDTAHGIYGVNTRKLLADIDAELADRFGVTSINRRPA